MAGSFSGNVYIPACGTSVYLSYGAAATIYNETFASTSRGAGCGGSVSVRIDGAYYQSSTSDVVATGAPYIASRSSHGYNGYGATLAL